MINIGIKKSLHTLMNKDEKVMLMQELAELQQEHRDLKTSITDLQEEVYVNQLELTRLKKRKLKLKDAIERIKSKLIPDMHA